MSFDKNIAPLIQRLPSLLEHLQTEEATKHALVMPFIAALGYDVFNPQEVIPEFVADVGLKKGEKVDYAVKLNGEIILIVECKQARTNLSTTEMSQLFRYFAVTKARIALLTNGVQYWFYSDLEEPNKMDPHPFLELDLSNPRPSEFAEILNLTKDDFDINKMLGVALDLKYTSLLRKVVSSQFDLPDEDLVKLFYVKSGLNGRFTSNVKDRFSPLVRRTIHQLISDRVNERLRIAIQSEMVAAEPPVIPMDDGAKVDIVTTEDEHEGFRIVRAIVGQAVSYDRVSMRDAKTYCGILLDDNNRKPICRLWFNGKQKWLGTFNTERTEVKVELSCVSDIYKHAGLLLGTIQNYEPNGDIR